MPLHFDDAGGSGPDLASLASALRGSVESVSTRVLLDGSGRECRGCEASIDIGARYRCLTVRDSDGDISEVCLCCDDCVESLLE